MKLTLHSYFPLLILVTAVPCHAAVLGVDNFDTAGAIAGQTGGTGWNRNNITGSPTSGVSDWDLNFGTSGTVSSGQLVLSDSAVLREFNGPGEGIGSIFSDSDSDEEKGSIRATGTVFMTFNMTRSTSSGWSGIASFDFGTERVFFGVPFLDSGNDTIGIEAFGLIPTFGSIHLTDNVNYTMLAVVDFDNNMLGLYVNPDSLDTWNGAGGTADVTRGYIGANWISGVRLASDNPDIFVNGVTTFDNLKVTTTIGELGLPGAIPEPSTSMLGVLALGLLGRRRRASAACGNHAA